MPTRTTPKQQVRKFFGQKKIVNMAGGGIMSTNNNEAKNPILKNGSKVEIVAGELI